MEKHYAELREKVEKVVGRKMDAPRDFDYLSTRILGSVNIYVAPVTLKRFWGYFGKERQKVPYRNTLNILAQYAGYHNFDAFCAGNSEMTSDFLPNDCLQVNSLLRGDVVEIKWEPGHCVVVQYEGMYLFKVIESLGSKLACGDTFQLWQIIDGEPLFLQCLVHNGNHPVNYVCGMVGGVKYVVRKK